jgi:DNA-directed RNA polymerase subunit K/omega
MNTEKKKTISTTTTQTRNVTELSDRTSNIYETVMIITKRANQISAEQKQELTRKLEEFTSLGDSIEEIFENREQIEISKFYEKQPKPALLAIDEFLSSKIYYRLVEKKDKEKDKDKDKDKDKENDKDNKDKDNKEKDNKEKGKHKDNKEKGKYKDNKDKEKESKKKKNN